MKVKELKELLATLDDDMEVIMSKDGEGNSYSPLADYSDQYRYNPDSTWSGELTSEERCAEEREEDGLKGLCEHTDCRYGEGIPAVVLWPTN